MFPSSRFRVSVSHFAIAVWVVWCHASVPVQAVDSRANAVLQAAISQRQDVKSMAVNFDLHNEAPSPPIVSIRAECLGELRRSEAFDGTKLIEKTLILPDCVWHYSPGSNNLLRMSFQTAVDRGIFCIDPRLLGAVSVLHIADSIGSLIDDDPDSVFGIGTAEIEGVECEVIRRHRARKAGGAHDLDYSIDTHTGRIYRIFWTMTSNPPRKREPTEMLAHFDDPTGGEFDWLPRSIECDHPVAGFDCRNIVLLSDDVDEDRFTLVGLDLPVGLSVHDKALRKRLGYWDGREIVPDFPLSYAGEVVPPPGYTWRFYGMIALAFVVVASGIWYLRGHRHV